MIILSSSAVECSVRKVKSSASTPSSQYDLLLSREVLLSDFVGESQKPLGVGSRDDAGTFAARRFPQSTRCSVLKEVGCTVQARPWKPASSSPKAGPCCAAAGTGSGVQRVCQLQLLEWGEEL